MFFLLTIIIFLVAAVIILTAATEKKEHIEARRKAARVLERMTRDEIMAVLHRTQAESDAAGRHDAEKRLVDAIMKIRDRRAIGGPHDPDVATLTKKAHEAINRYAVSADSQRGVERLATGLLAAWARAPGGAADAQAQVERLAAAAFDILVRHAGGGADTISDDEELVALALEALTSGHAAGTHMSPRVTRVVTRALNTLDRPASQPG